MNAIVWPFLAEVTLITYRSFTGEHFAIVSENSTTSQPNVSSFSVDTGVKRPPLPSEIVAPAVFFVVCGAISQANSRVGQLLGWGIVLSTALLMFGSGKTTPSTNTASGTPATPLLSAPGSTAAVKNTQYQGNLYLNNPGS